MTCLNIDCEWESPEGARGDELRATWARMKIAVGEQETITRVEDRNSESVRSAIYAPAYPLAEWIVTNWWSLLYEVPSPHRLSNGYHRRHNIRTASEGYALPSLDIQPEGSRIIISWQKSQHPVKRINFLSEGRAAIERAEIEDSLTSFVTKVITRLNDQGIDDTLLVDEWKAIQE